MRFKYSPIAESNFDDIGEYYFKVGGNQLAKRMIQQIRGEIKSLLNYTAPSYELVPGIRRLIVASGAYLVFHRVNQTESMIEVIHVRRSEREAATDKALK